MATQAGRNVFVSEGSLEYSEHSGIGRVLSQKSTKRSSSSFVEAEAEREASKRPLGAKLTAAFLNLDKAKSLEENEGRAGCAYFRFYLRIMLNNALTNTVMTLIILADLAVGVVEVNSRASGLTTPEWAMVMSSAFLVIYSVELLLTAIIVWPRWRHDTFFLLDAAIVALAVLDYVIQALALDLEQLVLVRVLRVSRILRLLRLFRKAGSFRSLRKLLLMALSSVRTLLWSFLLCALLLTFWSMAAVELLHPVLRKMSDEGQWSDCPRCSQAFASVQRAFLTLVKLSMTGEDFGLFAEPLMTEHPWAAILLMGSMLSVVFGVLNLVVAVVIDEFAERRANDFMTRADEMDEELHNDKKRLQKIFDMVDEDGSGEVTLDELQSGAHRVPEFRNTLRWMDIDQADIEQLFDMLDDDGSGEIESAEFVGVLSRWMRDSKTAGRFVRYNIMKVQEDQAEMHKTVVALFNHLDGQLKMLAADASNSNMHAQQAHVVGNLLAQDSHPAEKLLAKIEHQLDQLPESCRPQAPTLETAMEEPEDQWNRAQEMIQSIKDELRLLSDNLKVALQAEHREKASKLDSTGHAQVPLQRGSFADPSFPAPLYEDVDPSFAEPLHAEYVLQPKATSRASLLRELTKQGEADRMNSMRM